jgi:hypothetical protein
MQKLREAKIEVTHKLIENILKRCDEYEKLKGFKKLHELRQASEENQNFTTQINNA